jgi:hypothetical protein
VKRILYALLVFLMIISAVIKSMFEDIESLAAFYASTIFFISVLLFVILLLRNDIVKVFFFFGIVRKIIFIPLTTVLILFFTYKLFINFMDFPTVMTENYASVEGICSDKQQYELYGRYFRGHNISFLIGGEDFKLAESYSNFISEGSIYRVFYLPHSRFIVKIYSVN